MLQSSSTEYAPFSPPAQPCDLPIHVFPPSVEPEALWDLPLWFGFVWHLSWPHWGVGQMWSQRHCWMKPPKLEYFAKARVEKQCWLWTKQILRHEKCPCGNARQTAEGQALPKISPRALRCLLGAGFLWSDTRCRWMQQQSRVSSCSRGCHRKQAAHSESWVQLTP